MVNTVLSTAISGLNAASERVNRAADNIANMTTEGHPSGGGATLPQDIVDLKLGEIEFKANIAVAKTAEDMSDTLLNLFDEEV
ncbi:MAG: hypothetical protein CL570_05020 [Alphaproteobacteria bacterium]|nr:hypothetical protein [Alphaproteobacteria bacterium]HCQ70579.1 hypothetical protein [Rhodospirillaceae bacterium]|tara:strand:- start:49014 stop:49262 length:249 start_codon:yes stop_codon:yes gene_type:complete